MAKKTIPGKIPTIGKTRKEADSVSKESVRMALFIAEYPKDLNASKAAQRAGYKWPDKVGSQLLKHPAVKAALAASIGEKMELAGLEVDRTLEEVRRLAFFDPIDLLEADGSVKQMKDIPEAVRSIIASFEIVELFEGTGENKHCYGLLKKIKFTDRQCALDKLMRYHSLYTDKIEHSGTVGITLIHSIPRPEQ